MRCPTCGKTLAPTARYCENCGTAMERCHDDGRNPADFGCRHDAGQDPTNRPRSRQPRRAFSQRSPGSLVLSVIVVIIVLVVLINMFSILASTNRHINRSYEIFDRVAEEVFDQGSSLNDDFEADPPKTYGKGK